MSTKDGRFWVYPYLEGAPGPGFGGGFGFVYKDAFHRGWKFAGRYDLRINLNQYARFGVEKKELFNISGHGADFSLDSRWAHDGYNNYYGIGEGSSSSNHATYSSHIVRNRFKLDFELLRHVGVGPRFGLDTVWAKSVAKDGHPGVSDIFPVAELVGLDKTINYLVPGAELWFDNRNDDNFPNSGGRYSAGIWRYQAIDLGGVSYNQYEFNLQHNFTLWHPEIVLTLQNKWKVKQATSGDKVPFELLTVLDYSSPLRGFSGGRFHDRSSVLFNIEYRYPVWNVIYGVLFVDAGKVFRKLDQFDLDNFKFSGGGGFRFHYKKIALFNLDIGYGGEGVKFIFGIQKLL
jgi:outer membrane protein assembly factor BamA